MSTRHYRCGRLMALVPLCVAFAVAAGAVDVTKPQPARAELLPIPPTDLTGMEAQVQAALQAARSHFQTLAAAGDRSDRDLAAAFGELGGTYQIHHLYAPAAACYQNAGVLEPSEFRWPYYLGYVHHQAHRNDEAVDSFRRALGLRPEDPYAQLRLAHVYLEINQPDAAAPLLQNPAEVPDLRAAALYALGKVALMRRDYQQAVAFFEETLAVYPEADKVHYPLAMAYRGLGNVARAREHLAQRGNGEPSIPDPLMDELNVLLTGARPHLYRAIDAVRTRHFDVAAEAFGKGLELEPDNVNARVSWARSLYIVGDTKAAQTQLREALHRQPDHDLAHFLLGVLLEHEGDIPKGLAHYREALAINPDNGGAHFFLANAMMRAGTYEQAAYHYRRAVECVPDNLPAWLLEAVALVRADGSQAQARSRLTTALEVHPETPVLTYALARLLAASPDATVRDGRRALELAQALYDQASRPEHAELMAMAQAELGNFDLAVSFQEEAFNAAMFMGRLDVVPRLSDNLDLYRAKRPCRDPWPASDPMFQPPPIDAMGPFRDYPSSAAI